MANKNETRIESEGIKKTRLEVILSQAIEDDFLHGIDAASPGIAYTRLDGATGRGFSVPKLGDSIWPQLNSVMVLYVTPEEESAVRGIVKKLRTKYAGEGLACFRSEAEEL